MGSLPKNAGLLLEFDKASFLVTHFSYYTVINASPDSIIFNNDIYADDAIFYSSVVEAPDFWQWLELSCELVSDQGNTIDFCMKLFVDFNIRKS